MNIDDRLKRITDNMRNERERIKDLAERMIILERKLDNLISGNKD